MNGLSSLLFRSYLRCQPWNLYSLSECSVVNSKLHAWHGSKLVPEPTFLLSVRTIALKKKYLSCLAQLRTNSPKYDLQNSEVIKAHQLNAIIQQAICTCYTVDLITHCSVMFESSVITLPVSATSLSLYELNTDACVTIL